MGKSSRQKRRTYQTPKRSRNGANLIWYAMAGILVVGGVLAVALSRGNSASGVAPTTSDHWHVALGVDDCGTWAPNWVWPPGNVTGANSVGVGAPSRAGSGGLIYAPLHSHDDGLIHIEPLVSSDGGKNATLGKYFTYGGWKISATSLSFTGVNEKNGNKCDGKPGVLRWAVNGKEHLGDPADYKLAEGDVVELLFTTKTAKIPPVTDVPSYSALQSILGTAVTTAPAPTVTPTASTTATTVAGSTTTVAPPASTTSPTTVGNTTTPAP
jgi:hypothetical protein